MNPRALLNFLRSKSGKLILFGLIFTAALVVFASVRSHRVMARDPVTMKLVDLDLSTNKSQTVESITRPMQDFRPPPAKPEPPQKQSVEKLVTAPAAAPKPEPVQQLPAAPLSLLAETPHPEPKRLSDRYAPFGRLIPCETVVTVDSASIQTPIIGLVTENIYHAGKLIIRAGTEIHGTAQTDRSRERIASGSSWRFVCQTGEELTVKAIALDREFDNSTNQTGWGITDGSAGIRGRLIKSDDMAEIKLFAATFLSGAANALTEKEQTVFGTLETPSLNNAPFKGAQQVLAAYAQRIYESIQRDGFYVRIPSGKQFYLYVLQTIDAADARIGGGETPSAPEAKFDESENPQHAAKAASNL